MQKLHPLDSALHVPPIFGGPLLFPYHQGHVVKGFHALLRFLTHDNLQLLRMPRFYHMQTDYGPQHCSRNGLIHCVSFTLHLFLFLKQLWLLFSRTELVPNLNILSSFLRDITSFFPLLIKEGTNMTKAQSKTMSQYN